MRQFPRFKVFKTPADSHTFSITVSLGRRLTPANRTAPRHTKQQFNRIPPLVSEGRRLSCPQTLCLSGNLPVNRFLLFSQRARR